MSPKTIIITQARMDSTRLPGKVLKMVLGKPLLQHHLERLKSTRRADGVIVAMTREESDAPLVDFCEKHHQPYYRGSQHDVLERFLGAAEAYKADHVVRVTSDCPLIDPGLIDQLVGDYVSVNPPCDYASNVLERSYPRGLDCEVFSIHALRQAHKHATLPSEREHVTPYIYKHPESFRLRSYKQPDDWSHYRWAVDTLEDFELVKQMLEALIPKNPLFTWKEAVAWLSNHPELVRINAHVEQKTL